MHEIGPENAERYAYPDCPDVPFVPSWNGWETAPDVEAPGPEGVAAGVGRGQRRPSAGPELEEQLAEEARRSFEVGRARGVEEGRKAERAAQAAAIEEANVQRLRRAAELIETFAQQRGRYFHAAEQEVVRLALAVAARILRREAESDPLLLIGAVRAALGQIAGAAEVRLRVPAAELELWTEAIALLPHLSVRPKIVAGAGMQLGECGIEASVGSADLGLRAQLAEMERGLLAAPGGGAGELREVQSESAAIRAETAA